MKCGCQIMQIWRVLRLRGRMGFLPWSGPVGRERGQREFDPPRYARGHCDRVLKPSPGRCGVDSPYVCGLRVITSTQMRQSGTAHPELSPVADLIASTPPATDTDTVRM